MHGNRHAWVGHSGSRPTAAAFGPTLGARDELYLGCADGAVRVFGLGSPDDHAERGPPAAHSSSRAGIGPGAAPLAVLRAHRAAVQRVVASPDGSLLLTVSAERAIIWETATWTRRRTLRAGAAIVDAAFASVVGRLGPSPSSSAASVAGRSVLVAGFRDDSVVVWLGDTLSPVAKLTVPPKEASTGSVLSSVDAIVTVGSPDGGEAVEAGLLAGHEARACPPWTALVAAGTRTGSVLVWTVSPGAAALRSIVDMPASAAAVVKVRLLPRAAPGAGGRGLHPGSLWGVRVAVLDDAGTVRVLARDGSAWRALAEVAGGAAPVVDVAVRWAGAGLLGDSLEGGSLLCGEEEHGQAEGRGIASSSRRRSRPGLGARSASPSRSATETSSGSGPSSAFLGDGGRDRDIHGSREHTRGAPVGRFTGDSESKSDGASLDVVDMEVGQEDARRQTERTQGPRPVRVTARARRGGGAFPDDQRLLAWRFLLRLPGNARAFHDLRSAGQHPAFDDLGDRFPMRSRRLLSALQDTVSVLAHWCPALADAPWLPNFVFPFVKLTTSGSPAPALVRSEVCALLRQHLPTDMGALERLIQETWQRVPADVWAVASPGNASRLWPGIAGGSDPDGAADCQGAPGGAGGSAAGSGAGDEGGPAVWMPQADVYPSLGRFPAFSVDFQLKERERIRRAFEAEERRFAAAEAADAEAMAAAARGRAAADAAAVAVAVEERRSREAAAERAQADAEERAREQGAQHRRTAALAALEAGAMDTEAAGLAASEHRLGVAYAQARGVLDAAREGPGASGVAWVADHSDSLDGYAGVDGEEDGGEFEDASADGAAVGDGRSGRPEGGGSAEGGRAAAWRLATGRMGVDNPMSGFGREQAERRARRSARDAAAAAGAAAAAAVMGHAFSESSATEDRASAYGPPAAHGGLDAVVGRGRLLGHSDSASASASSAGMGPAPPRPGTASGRRNYSSRAAAQSLAPMAAGRWSSPESSPAVSIEAEARRPDGGRGSLERDPLGRGGGGSESWRSGPGSADLWSDSMDEGQPLAGYARRSRAPGAAATASSEEGPSRGPSSEGFGSGGSSSQGDRRVAARSSAGARPPADQLSPSPSELEDGGAHPVVVEAPLLAEPRRPRDTHSHDHAAPASVASGSSSSGSSAMHRLVAGRVSAAAGMRYGSSTGSSSPGRRGTGRVAGFGSDSGSQ
ncbi:hypothetical protein FNF27_02866 [Cafeteria roenbergensis]|uniref:Uncharacterized protein n=1 Tax=Cafeteria roenbergensis TaxID=33653 RepID=A0A5A8EIP2_CAFRO|nr:hypothetical protein FNF27_02866 [Cafeteria roenbergensis]